MWSKHGPGMVPKIIHAIDIALGPIGLENCGSLASLKVKLKQRNTDVLYSYILDLS